MKKFPTILSERDTLLAAINGRSLGRFGDGEIRLAYGGRAASQIADPRLAQELRRMLVGDTKCLTCLPNLFSASPALWFWERYRKHKFIPDLKDKSYGSTWITRPDCAPWIDTEDYWALIRQLWKDKDVILVTGDQKSLTPSFMHDARSVRVVMSIRQHAYKHINEIEEQIGCPSISVLMCLGATATVLAERLARRGIHGVDLGHVGMFMRRRQARLAGQVEQANAADHTV